MKDIEVTYKGTKCVWLPGSEYFVTSEGTLIKVTSLVTYNDKPGYRVTRKGTRKYYSKESLVKLYNKFLKK